MHHRNPREGGGELESLEGTQFKFGQLILEKIIKIVATGCHILRLKCTKFDLGWGGELGLRPRPRWGSSQRSPKPPSWI